MSTPLRITELDFEEIKQNLKTFLQSQNTFRDYNFEGSGLAVLLDLLAYNTHYNAYYLNMLANEMFLDTAIVRDSVFSHAKKLNYVPVSEQGATAVVNITVTPPGGNTQTSLLLDRYQVFQAKAIDGVTYSFTNTEAHTIQKENGVFLFSNVTIQQGETQTTTTLYNATSNPSAEFDILNEKADTDTLLVEVQVSQVNTSSAVYTRADDITEVNSDSKVYFLTTGIDEQYKIRFGDGVVGKALSNGNVILINYLIVDGDAANYANTFSTGSIGGFSNVSIETVSAAAGGAERQSLASIRYRAPLAYTAQNRMVTASDYETLLLTKYPAIQSLAVWGGEENKPPVYGKVFLSYLLTAGSFINETEKQRILDDLVTPYTIVSITPQFIDPDYLFVLLKANFHYVERATTLTNAQMVALVRTEILNYMSTEFNKFGGMMIPSRLERNIDDTNSSITGSHVTVTLQKRFTPTLEETRNYNIDFGFSLHRGGVNDILTSTGFYIYDTLNVLRLAYIDEAPNSFTGVDDILIDNPGFSYSEAPTVTITGDGSGANAIATIVNGKVQSITLDDRGEDYTRAIVLFSGGGSGQGASATAVISARFGTLRTFYYNDLAQKVLINTNAGTIDHINGTIALTNFKPISLETTDGQIRLSIEADEDILQAQRNQIITLDATDVSALTITGTPMGSL